MSKGGPEDFAPAEDCLAVTAQDVLGGLFSCPEREESPQCPGAPAGLCLAVTAPHVL